MFFPFIVQSLKTHPSYNIYGTPRYTESRNRIKGRITPVPVWIEKPDSNKHSLKGIRKFSRERREKETSKRSWELSHGILSRYLPPLLFNSTTSKFKLPQKINNQLFKFHLLDWLFKFNTFPLIPFTKFILCKSNNTSFKLTQNWLIVSIFYLFHHFISISYRESYGVWSITRVLSLPFQEKREASLQLKCSASSLAASNRLGTDSKEKVFPSFLLSMFSVYCSRYI